MVTAAGVESRGVRQWLNAECCLEVMIHSGKKSRPHPGFLATSPAHVSLMGVAVPWDTVRALPA
eukprot:1314815-Prorocentrum_lima.AAC.1